MSVKITWLGHACFAVESDGRRLVIDPFLKDNSTAPIEPDEVKADFIFLTHGHFDHVADAPSIAKRTGAAVLCNFEVGEWVKKQGVAEDKVVQLNPGGAVKQPFGRTKFTIAQHSSSMPDGSYGGVAGGFIIETGGKRLYFAGDTALFLDMKLIGIGGLDLAVVPIGDRFTMGPEDSIEAVKLLNPKRVGPCHYNTWPDIAQNPHAWAGEVKRSTAADPQVVEPGASFVV
jgi:L-ascorbate metabolism protein UlaG (beta-lactamase superfamily)